MVVRGDRIVVPETLRQKLNATEIAHEGHQGQVRTKQPQRAHVWFPGMDSQCDNFESTCIYCQSNTPDAHREPLKMTELPEGPWRKVSVDFCGPLANGDLAFVFHCQYSRYPVVEFVGSTSEKATISVFRRVFDTYGLPEVVKSDNGPPFNSHKFEEYAREERFKHQKVTAGWPEANGDVERCMQRIKKTARIDALQVKADRSVKRCAGGSGHTEQLYTRPLELARINLCSGANSAESSQKPADKLSTQMTPRSVSVTESKKRK